MKTVLSSFFAFALLFAGPAQAAPNDNEILNIIKTTNELEIDASKVAKSRSKNPEVTSYAEMMITEHKSNEKKGKEVSKAEKIKPKSNELAKELKKENKEKISGIKKLKGHEFDKAFMDLQVEMHTRLLTDLENSYIPGAQNSQLKSFLEETKTHVQEHLTKAQHIQTTLNR